MHIFFHIDYIICVSVVPLERGGNSVVQQYSSCMILKPVVLIQAERRGWIFSALL